MPGGQQLCIQRANITTSDDTLRAANMYAVCHYDYT